MKSLITVAASSAGFSCRALEVRSEGLQHLPPRVPAACSPAGLRSTCSQLRGSAQEEQNEPLRHPLKPLHTPTLRQKLGAGRSRFPELMLWTFGFQPFPLRDAVLPEGLAQAPLCPVTLQWSWSCLLPPCREHRAACPPLTLLLPQPARGSRGCDPSASPFASSPRPHRAQPGPGALGAARLWRRLPHGRGPPGPSSQPSGAAGVGAERRALPQPLGWAKLLRSRPQSRSRPKPAAEPSSLRREERAPLAGRVSPASSPPLVTNQPIASAGR